MTDAGPTGGMTFRAKLAMTMLVIVATVGLVTWAAFLLAEGGDALEIPSDIPTTNCSTPSPSPSAGEGYWTVCTGD